MTQTFLLDRSSGSRGPLLLWSLLLLLTQQDQHHHGGSRVSCSEAEAGSLHFSGPASLLGHSWKDRC